MIRWSLISKKFDRQNLETFFTIPFEREKSNEGWWEPRGESSIENELECLHLLLSYLYIDLLS